MKIPPSKILAAIGLWGGAAVIGFVAGRYTAPVAKPQTVTVGGALGSALKGKSIPNIGIHEAGDITLDALLKTAGRINAADLARLVEGMKLEDIAKAIDLLQSLPAGGARDQLLDAIVMQWAKINPKGFLDKMSSISSPRMREDGVVVALRAWGAQDPAAALDWLKNNPGGVSNNVMQARYASAIAGIIANDPTAALNFYNTLGPNDQNLAQVVLRGIVDGFASIGRFTDAVGLIQQLPAGNAQNLAFNMLMNQWAAAAPADAAAWVATLTDPMQKSRYLQTIAQAWALSDPVGAAKWASELDLQMLADPNALAAGGQRGGRGGRGGPGGGGATGTLLASTITQWAQVDLDGVAAYLNTLSASPSKDQAVAAFLRQAGSEDPEGSLAWIKSISDPNLQQQSLANLVRNWQQTDPQGYQAYLATLSPTDAATLQNATAFGGGRRGGGGPGGAGNAGVNGGGQVLAGNQGPGGGGRRGGGGAGAAVTNTGTGGTFGGATTPVAGGGGRRGGRGGG